MMDEDSSLCFLGDWHYHPWGKGHLSRTDEETLLSLRADEDYFLGERAITMILTFSRGRLRPRAFGWDGVEIIELPVCQRQKKTVP